MKRNEFVALIGYDGRRAIIDKIFASKHGNQKTLQLAELGYYKAALCSAIHSQLQEECDRLVQWLHERDIFSDYDCDGLKALFGVWQVEEVEKVLKV